MVKQHHRSNSNKLPKRKSKQSKFSNSLSFKQKKELVVAGSLSLNDVHSTMNNANPVFAGMYSNRDTILLVGEGNFTFASALSVALGGSKIVATSLDSKATVIEKYGDVGVSSIQACRSAGTKIFHDIDATKTECLAICKGSILRFSKVIFNFPHVGGATEEAVLENQNVLAGLFKALLGAKLVSAEAKSQVHITLRNTIFYDSWNVEAIGLENGFELLEKVAFPSTTFHELGYREARTNPAFRDSPAADNAFTYVFIVKS